MVSPKRFLTVLFNLSLLTSPASAAERGPQLSLWGEAASFTSGCNHWRLKPHVSIPALQEVTVCFKLKFEIGSSPTWTAFMYRHPQFQYAELGLGGSHGSLVVWLCGEVWTTPQFNFQQSQWYSLCLTWSHTKHRPDLYINGTLAAYVNSSPSFPCSELAADGTLTLGASHTLNNHKIEIIPFTTLLGKVSLFRLWARERSKQEVTSLTCTEGDLLTWEADNWDTQICAPLPESSLQCEWSIYKVRLTFTIFRYDGNDTELYTARDKALRWLEDVLPIGIYLHRLTVSELNRPSEGEKTTPKDMTESFPLPNINSYDCLVHVSVTPSMNVADVQKQMHAKLRIPYDASVLLRLVADADSIYTRPVESFPASTTKPGVITDASVAATTPVTSTLPPVTMIKTTTPPTTPTKGATASSTSTVSNTLTSGPTVSSTLTSGTTDSSTLTSGTTDSSTLTSGTTDSSTLTSGTTDSSTLTSGTTVSSTLTSGTTDSSTLTSGPTVSSTLTSGTTDSSTLTSGTTDSSTLTSGTTDSSTLTSGTTVSSTLTSGTTDSSTLTSGPTVSSTLTSGPTVSSTLTSGTTDSSTLTSGTTVSSTLTSRTTDSSTLTSGTTDSSTLTSGTTDSSTLTSGTTDSSTLTSGPTVSSTLTSGTTDSSTLTSGPTVSSTLTSRTTDSSTLTSGTTDSSTLTSRTTDSSTLTSGPTFSSTLTSGTTDSSTLTSGTTDSSTLTSGTTVSSTLTSGATVSSSSTVSRTPTSGAAVSSVSTTSSTPASAIATAGAVTTSTTSPTTAASASSTSLSAATSIPITSPTNICEHYFEVSINVSLTGDCDPEQTISTWLNSSLPSSLMMVLDLQLLSKAQRHQTIAGSKHFLSDYRITYEVLRESCIFQVQVMMSLSDTQEMEQLIRDLLLIPYSNGSISIATENVEISRILVFRCDAEIEQTRKGLFQWTATIGGKKATQACPKNPQRSATRYCKLGLSTHWMDPDLEDCALVVETIPDLDDIEVTADNALDVVEMIKDLLSNHSTLNYDELVTVLKKLQDIVTLSVVTPNLGQALINIISNILESESNLVPFTNTILNITETVGDKMVGYEGFSTLVAPALGISVVDMVPGEFTNLTFGVSSDGTGTNPEIFINKVPFNGTVAFISLPSVLHHNFPQQRLNQNPPRVQFQFYGIPGLFESSQKGKTLNTFVVSASVTNASSPVQDLKEHVRVSLQHLTPNTNYMDVECVYWNLDKNNGHGGWDDYGCRKFYSSSAYTTCLCDHLTHFGVLLDLSREELDSANEQILTIITYVGCGVSSLFLGITVLTYTAFEKLRRDYPSQILINLSLALLGLNLVFLVNSWLSSWGVYGLCVTAGSMLHYFLLASFTWMGLEAVNMYLALVKVFNVYVPSYILKFCILGWGIPLVICTLVLIVNREAYGSNFYTDAQSGSLDNSDNFCWLQDNVTFYVTVVAYALLIFLFNIAVFVVVLMQIRHMRANSPAGTRSGLIHDLRGVASITLLLGLTWTVGFFTWGPARVVLLYLFSGLNSLQGLFIFLFHCLMKENVRKQWRIHLCIGRFRLDEYSEWSNSASVGVVAKPRLLPPKASVPSIRSVKSSSTDSTSASSGSSQREASCMRPSLGLFVYPLALPRAHRSPTSTGAPVSHRGMNPTPGWRNHLLSHQEQR